jgi:purine-binding chemotaxis protein CheW
MVMEASGSDSYVVFELAGASYALRSDDVQQLEMVTEPTPVPNAPAYVDGVVAVRGQVIPAVSLRARFGFPRVPHDVRTRLIVVRARGRTVGLIVDGAREFANIPAESIEPLPEGIGGMSGRYLRGIAPKGDRLLLVVDVTELLDHDIEALADVEVESNDLVTSPEPPTASGATTLN